MNLCPVFANIDNILWYVISLSQQTVWCNESVGTYQYPYIILIYKYIYIYRYIYIYMYLHLNVCIIMTNYIRILRIPHYDRSNGRYWYNTIFVSLYIILTIICYWHIEQYILLNFIRTFIIIFLSRSTVVVQ